MARVFNPGAQVQAPRSADGAALARLEAKVDALVEAVNGLLSALDADNGPAQGEDGASQWHERDQTESLD